MDFSLAHNLIKKKKLLILYDDMKGWDANEIEIPKQSIGILDKDLKELNVNFQIISSKDGLDKVINKFNPANTVIFNWVESINDEPNTYHLIPPIYEKYNFIYTGSDSKTLELTTYKNKTMKAIEDLQIPIPVTRYYENSNNVNWSIFPCIVKPCAEHGSDGITRDAVIDNMEQLVYRIAEISERFKNGVIVQEFLEGTEYNVSLWGNETLEYLPISSMEYSDFEDYHDRICGFDAKWNSESSSFGKVKTICPTIIPKYLGDKITILAKKAYVATGCRDYGRIDIKLKNHEPVVIDINSNPDLSIDAGFYRSASFAGYNYGQMFVQIAGLAVMRINKACPPKAHSPSSARIL